MHSDLCVWLTMVNQTIVNANGTSTYMGVRSHRSIPLRAKYAR